MFPVDCWISESTFRVAEPWNRETESDLQFQLSPAISLSDLRIHSYCGGLGDFYVRIGKKNGAVLIG